VKGDREKTNRTKGGFCQKSESKRFEQLESGKGDSQQGKRKRLENLYVRRGMGPGDIDKLTTLAGSIVIEIPFARGLGAELQFQVPDLTDIQTLGD